MMKVKMSSILMSLFLLALLVAACAPAAAPTPAPAPKPTAPAAVATPTAAPAPAPTLAPAPTPRPVVTAPTATAAPAPKPAVAQPRYGGILKSSTITEPPTYDVNQEVSYSVLHPLSPVYNLLVRMDPKEGTKVVPDLAEKWEISPDGKVYTFSLQKGVKWHDGTPFTSADVKATFERIASPPKGMVSPRAGFYKNIVTIETPDANTVRFNLKNPQGAFLAMAAVPFSVILPKHILDQKGDMKRDVMGTGPFVFKEHIRGVQWKFEKNPNYFLKGLPYLDGIVRYVVADETAIQATLKTKGVDLLQAREHRIKGPVRVAMQKAMPELVFQSYTDPILYGVIPNFLKKEWQDVRVRKAAWLALDAGGIRDIIEPESPLGGFLTPGSGWEIPWKELEGKPGFRKPTAEDLAQAKKLLAEAGYPDGFSFKWLVRGLKIYSDLAVLAKDQFGKIGLKSELEIREDAIFWPRRLSGEWDIMIYGAVADAMSDPDIIMDRYITGSTQNYGKYSNKKVDELYAKQSAIADLAERKKAVLEIQKILLEDPVNLPIVWINDSAIFYPKVKNYYHIGLYNGNRMDDVWLAE